MSFHAIEYSPSDEGSEEDQDDPPVQGQGRTPREYYASLARFRESREIYMLHATHRRLQRLSQFVRPSPPGLGECPIESALNVACDVEDEMEDFLEEALAKLDGISRKLDQEVDVLSEHLLKENEWYQGGKMFCK